MEFLIWLEGIRNTFLDKFMLTITYLGDETAFLVIALILFWCVNKRHGYYVLLTGFFGTVISQCMKICFRIPRPWVTKPGIALEEAMEGAGGYSFPSGHTQSSIGTFGGVAVTTENKWLRGLSLAVCILVPFSRMYVGVHTPLDVGIGALIAVVLLLVLHPLVLGHDGKYIPYVLAAMTVAIIAYTGFMHLYLFPEEVYTSVDASNGRTAWMSAARNAYTLLGAVIGFLIVYAVDEKWLHFPVKAVWWAQLVKLIVGILLVLAVKEGMRAPLEMVLDELPARAVRYFLVVLVAGLLWPLSFRWFARLGKKE